MISQLRNAPRSTLRIFFWPLIINSICLVGLVSALIGNGWLDLLSWVCLGGVSGLMIYIFFSTNRGCDDL